MSFLGTATISVVQFAYGRQRHRNCQPQPTASKPAPAKEMASRTLAWPPEKTENREASVGAKTPTSQGWRSRGQTRKLRQHWGNGQKKSQPDKGWDFTLWWSRRESNSRPQTLHRPLYILRVHYLISPRRRQWSGCYSASHLNLALQQVARSNAILVNDSAVYCYT